MEDLAGIATDELDELDAEQLLAVSTAAVRARRLAEVRDLQVLLAWAVRHQDDPTLGPAGRTARKVGNVLRQLGGEGTPGVQDFCLGEIAWARGTGPVAAWNAMADALDLVHRLPLTWAVCLRGEADVFAARHTAKLSRHLSAERVGVVDAAVARVIGTESTGRVIAVAEGAVAKADPELHEQRCREEETKRYVRLSRTDEAGLRTVVARVEAGEGVWIDATVARVAEVIAPAHPDLNADEVRSVAFGWLARPAELLALLLEHTDASEQLPEGAHVTSRTDAADPTKAADVIDTAGAAIVEPTEAVPEPVAEPHLNRAVAFPADLLDALRDSGLAKRLRPQVVLYLHLCEESVRRAGPEGRVVARAEGLGPLATAQLQRLLGRADVRVQPVIDLADEVRTTAYEHTEHQKERVHLVTGGDYWPFATSTSRGIDYDHVTPYVAPDEGGPPGQTGPHNSGPLGRRHHRWKTHAGFRARQLRPGCYVWLSPHGLAFRVDHTGTHRIDPGEARRLIDAPDVTHERAAPPVAPAPCRESVLEVDLAFALMTRGLLVDLDDPPQ